MNATRILVGALVLSAVGLFVPALATAQAVYCGDVKDVLDSLTIIPPGTILVPSTLDTGADTLSGVCPDDPSGVPNCTTGPTETTDTNTDSERTTTCGDGYSCTTHDHYNDPGNDYTEYTPPGCENDPRYG